MRRRFRGSQARTILILIVVGLLVLARLWQERRDASRNAPLAEGLYRIERVVDGDTLLLTGGARVRLIGVDAPETVRPDHPVEPWGPEASTFTKDFLAGGEVRLQFDRERLDRYERYLAYVWVGDRMLNEELLRAGLATAELQFRYASSMKTRFRRAEQQARDARRGLWSTDP